MRKPITEPLKEFFAALFEELQPLMSRSGFIWVPPEEYPPWPNWRDYKGKFFRKFSGGWQDVEFSAHTCGDYEIEINISVSARLDQMDEFWMSKVLEMPDEIDEASSLISVYLGTYLYQWSLPTAENYPAPPRLPIRAENNNVLFYVGSVQEARNLVREFFLIPLERTMLPLILRCETVAGFVEVGKENPYFKVRSKAGRLVMASFANDVGYIDELMADYTVGDDDTFDKAVKVLCQSSPSLPPEAQCYWLRFSTEKYAEISKKADVIIRYPSDAGGCFIKGTRVHTKDGLKRIEEIEVGDYVLSSTEDGARNLLYKQVVKTFVHRNKTICSIHYYIENSESGRWLAATGNHPFWVEGIGWTRADQLRKRSVLRLANGKTGEVFSHYPVYRTRQEGVGWCQSGRDTEFVSGTLFNYAEYEDIPYDGPYYLEPGVYESDNPYLEVDVYNLKVEGNNTYYVGGDGVWVHNTNCVNLDPFGAEDAL